VTVAPLQLQHYDRTRSVWIIIIIKVQDNGKQTPPAGSRHALLIDQNIIAQIGSSLADCSTHHWSPRNNVCHAQSYFLQQDIHWRFTPQVQRATALATSVNYADLNNSMLQIRGHVCTRFFFAMTSYSCKVNTMVFVILLQVRKVYFLNRSHILMLLLV